jgi:hypothetical protein
LCRALLLKARTVSDECHRATLETLSLLRGARGYENATPNEDWKHLLASLERAFHENASDPELGPLFHAAITCEQDLIKRHKAQYMLKTTEA